MADERILIGQFIGKRAKNPDSPDSPFAPGGVVDPKKDFLEQFREPFTPTLPAKLPDEPAPQLSKPAVIGFEDAPKLTVPSAIPFEKAPPIPLSHPPADPIKVPEPPHTRVAAEEPHPTSPKSPPPADPIKVPEPPKTHIAAQQPSQFPQVPSVLPAEPAPPLSTPAALPPPPNVVLSSPGALPAPPGVTLSTPGTLPAPPAVTLSQPAPLPAPPTVKTPHDPTAGPQNVFTAQPKQHAPGGHLEPANDIQHQMFLADKGIQDVLNGIGGKFIGALGGPNSFPSPIGTQGDLAIDPITYAKNVARLGSSLGAVGLAVFAGEQLALFGLNNRGRIWNPLLAVPPPIVQGFLKPALDLQFNIPQLDGIPRPGPDDANDIHKLMAQGQLNVNRTEGGPPFIEKQNNVGAGGKPTGVAGVLQTIGKFFGGTGRIIGAPSQDTSLVDDPQKVDGPLVVKALEIRNKYHPGETFGGEDTGRAGHTYDQNAVAPIDTLIDDVFKKKNTTGHLIPGAKAGDLTGYSRKKSSGGGQQQSALGAFAATVVKLTGLGKSELKTGEQRPDPDEAKNDGKPLSSLSLVKSAFTQGIIPVRFKGENIYGFVTTQRGESPTKKITDDEAYVPLSFTDLRPINKIYRTVYFRPFITNLSEEFSPEWSEQNFFGRADPVATYMSTGRQITLGFKLVAFGPEDVAAIYQKLNWLASMVYPEYDSQLLYKSGPVVRMRVGDVINAIGSEGGRGLPGIIKSLAFDYNDTIWELQENFKVPRNVSVSLTFRVLHDRPIGRGEEGRFGGIGTIDSSGKYQPPGLGQGGAGSDADKKLPEVKKGIDSFRLVGGPDEADKMNYTDQGTIGQVDSQPAGNPSGDFNASGGGGGTNFA